MLNRTFDEPAQDAEPSASSVTEIGLPDLVLFVRRRGLLVAAIAGATVLLGIAYLLTSEPTYTASAQLLIDTKKVDPFGRGEVFQDVLVNTSDVESQVQVLLSDGLAGSVVDKLDLTHNEAFLAGAWNPISAAKSAILSLVPSSSSGGADPDADRSRAIATLEKNLSASRNGLSYMITVSYAAATPALAAEIANQVADSYLTVQLNAKLATAERASGWFYARLGKLRQQATQADNAVQAYGSAHGIVNTGPGKGLLNEQQLGELTTQLSAANAQVAQAKAQLATIDEIKKGDVPDATLSDTLRDPVFIQLRQQYLEASRNEADFAHRYGVNHQATVNLRNQMAEIKKAISSELDRIAASYRSDYQVAQARQKASQTSLAGLLSRASDQSSVQAHLRDLQSTASSLRSVYDAMLSRYNMSVQQESSPFTAARVVSPAAKPLTKSSPKSMLVLAASLFFGGVFGVGAGLARDLTDRRVRTRQQVASFTALNVIGVLPRLSFPADHLPAIRPRAAMRSFAGTPSQSVVLNHPFSAFSETIRGVKVAADLAGLHMPVKILGVVSAVPGEGKTTVAMNVARLAAQSGERVLIIDADLRRPSLSAALAAPGAPGLVQMLAGQELLDTMVWADEKTGLRLLPAGVSGKIINSHTLISSEAMRHLLQRATTRYDRVIVDLPPLLSVVDVHAAAHLFDAFVLVVEWGLSNEATLREALADDELRSRVLGAVLNKADVARMRQFDRSGSELTYAKYYEPAGY